MMDARTKGLMPGLLYGLTVRKPTAIPSVDTMRGGVVEYWLKGERAEYWPPYFPYSFQIEVELYLLPYLPYSERNESASKEFEVMRPRICPSSATILQPSIATLRLTVGGNGAASDGIAEIEFSVERIVEFGTDGGDEGEGLFGVSHPTNNN
jgi:hypothetical protein